MTTPHGATASSLPIRITQLTCSCSERPAAVRVCLGCYKYFCLACYEAHRRQISMQFGYIIHDSDIVLQAMLSTINQNTGHNVLHPIQLRNEIHEYSDRLSKELEHATRRALQSLRKIMDERSDKLIARIDPIRSDLNSSRELKHYIEAHLSDYREMIKRENDRVEQTATTTMRLNTARAGDIDWRYLIELQQVERERTNVIQYFGIIQTPNFDHLTKGHAPFKRLDNQKRGSAIAASDHLVIFVRESTEVCIIESNADYRTIVPLTNHIDPALKSPSIVDVCWSSGASLFILLSTTQVFTLSPNRKVPSLISNIHPPDDRLFHGCTCSGDILWLCYTGNATSIHGWSVANWTEECTWKPPVSCDEDKRISCMRCNLNGSLIGITLTGTQRKGDRFEVRNSRTMTCVWSRTITATYCAGLVPFSDSLWLVGIFGYHKVFLMDRDQAHPQEFTMTDPAKSSLRGMTLVDQGTVAVRSAETVIFFNLFD